MPVIHKAGASNHARPAVCPTGNGSHISSQVSDPRAKLRALAEAMGGPCIVRDADGNGFLLTVEALKIIDMPKDKSTPCPVIEELRCLIFYDPDTGIFIWKRRDVPTENSRGIRIFNMRYAGTRAFANVGTHGYLCGKVGKRNFLAHHVAWALHYGEWPNALVDHINRDKADNRIANLRLADRTVNAFNSKLRQDNTSGCRGVRRFKRDGSWQAYIKIRGRTKYLGVFDNIEDAIAARKAGEVKFGVDQFIPAGRTQEGAGVDTPSGSSATDNHVIHSSSFSSEPEQHHA